MNKIAPDMTRAITPPSLFGIDRRIAYANRKTILVGYVLVLLGDLLGVKLSGSLKMYRGANKSLARKERKKTTATEDFDVHISYL
jgi:hypothetical protein